MPEKCERNPAGKNGKKLKRKRRDSKTSVGENSKKKCEFNEIDPMKSYSGLGSNLNIDEDQVDRPFYGLLDDEEQEYFRRSDDLLLSNDFPDEEQRSLFLANVFREAENKELKIACSQSCSRLMERLILLCSVEQKKLLFRKFSGNFLNLIQHRFASHCCEMLFIQSAPFVTEELRTKSASKQSVKDDLPSMETLFLQVLDEFEGKMSLLLTDKFASHALRVLLILLDGRSPAQFSNKTLFQSKRKENIATAMLDQKKKTIPLSQKFPVPSSFTYAVEKIISDIATTLDSSFIRLLVTHPTGNPTLQLLVQLELHNPNFKKALNSDTRTTIISSILPDAFEGENSDSSVMINGLLYDPIGCHLLETICQFAPGKLFKQIYRSVIRDRIAAIARNEISSYTAICVLSRLSKQDLEEALAAIIPQIPKLIGKNRTLLIRTLVERCHIRGIDTSTLISAVSTAYGGQSENLILKMTCLDTVTLLLIPSPDDSEIRAQINEKLKPLPSQIHGSLLAQSLLMIPGPPSEIVQNALLSLPPQILLGLSLYTTTSHIIQSALSPSLHVPFRRKLINCMLFSSNNSKDDQDPILKLALSSAGSHVLDAVLTCTVSSAPSTSSSKKGNSTPLFSYAERISSTLTSYEQDLRASFFGRLVWRNWSLDLYKRARRDWIIKVKSIQTLKAPTLETVQGTQGNNDSTVTIKDPTKVRKLKRDMDTVTSKHSHLNEKSAIELARERHALRVQRKYSNLPKKT